MKFTTSVTLSHHESCIHTNPSCRSTPQFSLLKNGRASLGYHHSSPTGWKGGGLLPQKTKINMDQAVGKRWKKDIYGDPLSDPPAKSSSQRSPDLPCTCATHPMAGATGSLCPWDLLQGRHHRWGHYGECWSTHQRHDGKRREMRGQPWSQLSSYQLRKALE